MNGSTGLRVTGSVRSGSGAFSHPMSVFRKAYVPTSATPTATRETIRRSRSSSRCSTKERLSPCLTRRGRRTTERFLDALALASARGADLAPLLLLVVLVVPGHRVLELAHPAPDGAPDLRQPLRPEDEKE